MLVYVQLLISAYLMQCAAFQHNSWLKNKDFSTKTRMLTTLNLRKKDQIQRIASTNKEQTSISKTTLELMEMPLSNILTLANNGNMNAQYILSQKFNTGIEVQKDSKSAFKYAKLAADQGHTDCQSYVARSYTTGDGVEKNESEALSYWKLVADKGNAVGQYNYGALLNNIGKVPCNETRKYFLLASEQGHPDAQYNLAYMYENGIGGVVNMAEAFKWFKKAADTTHNSEAQYAIGQFFYYGKGVDINYKEAFKYFNMSSTQNNANGHFGVGLCYFHGRGVALNPERAFEYFKKADDKHEIGNLAVANIFDYFKSYTNNTFVSGTTIAKETRIRSLGGEYIAVFQNDGNFVVYDNYGRSQRQRDSFWHSKTYVLYGSNDYRLVFHSSGNLQIVDEEKKNKVIWETKTKGKDMRLVMQRDGNLVMYDKHNKKHWETGNKTNFKISSLF